MIEEIVAKIFRYIFILIIYYFIFNILKLMYLDIKSDYSKDYYTEGAYLKVVNRLDLLDFKMQEYYILKKTTTIGRSLKDNIVIKDKFISKNHTKIIEDNGEYFIEDMDSANGTFLNGNPVEEIVQLNNGDRIDIGLIQFIFVNSRR